MKNSLPATITVLTLHEPGLTDFAEARNKLLATVKTPWALFLDQDESLSKASISEITAAVSTSSFAAYWFPRREQFLGRILRHGEAIHTRFVRLARRDFGTWQRPVHEVWLPTSPSSQVGKLRSPLLHQSPQSLSVFLDKINFYSTLEANYRYQMGHRAQLWQLAVYPIAKFIRNYFFYLGFLDGVPGLIHAGLMSFHSYLTWSKHYLLCIKK